MIDFTIYLCPQIHSKVCFELLKTFRVTLERPCPNRGGSPPKSGCRVPIFDIIWLIHLVRFRTPFLVMERLKLA